MAKTITATAVISAKDATGATFDKIAQKMKGIEKVAKGFEGIKPLAKLGWGNGFEKELDRMKTTAREMAILQKSWANFNNALTRNGPMGASKALGALDVWKRGTLASLREVRVGMDAHEQHQRRFFQRAGRFGAGAAGMIGGAYLAERAGRGAIRSAADRSREMARFSLAGMTSDEQAQAMRKADEVSAKLPSMGRTNILDHILRLRGRLGSLPHALETVEDVSRAQVMLRTMTGGDASKDLEDLTMGLESQGAASDPKKFRSYLNSFVRAKALFPDTRGSDVREYMQRAGASRFGLSEDYIKNVVPTLANHEGWSNLGVMQASAFSALVGGRQTKKAKAAMAQYGLLDPKTGEIIDKKGFINNPYNWTIGHVKDAIGKQGISMDEQHRGDLVEAVTKMFSNRKVADYFASALLNEGLVSKDNLMQKNVKDIGPGSEDARRNDAFQAIDAISFQLKDAAASFIKLAPVTAGINAVAEKLAAAVSSFDQATPGQKAGTVVASTLLGGGAVAGGVMGAKALYGWFTGSGALMGSAAALDASAAALTSAAAALAGGKTLGEVASKVLPGAPAAAAAGGAGGGLLSKIWGAGAAALPFIGPAAVGAGAYFAAEAANDYSGITRESTRARQRRQQGKYNWYGKYIGDQGDGSLGGPEVSPTMTYGTGVGGDKSITVSGSVTGEGELKVTIEAGSSLLQVVEQANAAIRLVGQIQSNGPGSSGLSSTDAAAPARPSPGVGGFGP